MNQRLFEQTFDSGVQLGCGTQKLMHYCGIDVPADEPHPVNKFGDRDDEDDLHHTDFPGGNEKSLAPRPDED